jgi:hypothetical protein
MDPHDQCRGVSESRQRGLAWPVTKGDEIMEHDGLDAFFAERARAAEAYVKG